MLKLNYLKQKNEINKNNEIKLDKFNTIKSNIYFSPDNNFKSIIIIININIISLQKVIILVFFAPFILIDNHLEYSKKV